MGLSLSVASFPHPDKKSAAPISKLAKNTLCPRMCLKKLSVCWIKHSSIRVDRAVIAKEDDAGRRLRIHGLLLQIAVGGHSLRVRKHDLLQLL
jgi:hypothetical protein